MKVPKIIFKKISLEDNIEVIKWQYYADNDSLDMKNDVINYFPDLKDITGDYSKEEIDKKIEEVVSCEYYKKEKILDDKAEEYNKIWSPYNDKYLELLSEYFNIKWPDSLNEIDVTVGLMPVFPRNLEECSFMLGTRIDKEKFLCVTAHETLHFIWFMKWKEIHPETPVINYDSPFIEWQYSEMVTDPILNNKPFSELFDSKEKGYDSFYELYDGDSLVMDILRNIYSEDIPVDDKINKGFKYIKYYFENYKKKGR